jgi:hypothetical protein
MLCNLLLDFTRFLLGTLFDLRMEAVSSSETPLNFYHVILCHIPGEIALNMVTAVRTSNPSKVYRLYGRQMLENTRLKSVMAIADSIWTGLLLYVVCCHVVRHY